MDAGGYLIIGTIVVIVLFALFIAAIRAQNEGGEDLDTDDQSKGLTDDDVNRVTLDFWSRRKGKKQSESNDNDWHGGIAVFGPGVQAYMNQKNNSNSSEE